MAEYAEQGYTEPNYTEGDTVVTEITNCDLSSLQTEFNEIDTSLLSLDDKIDLSITKLNLVLQNFTSLVAIVQTLATKTDLQNKTIDLSSLATKTDILNLSNDIENIILPSLNGNGSEYKDGVQVTVSGRDVLYTVERSYHSLYSDNGYTVHYDLVSVDGYRVTVPEALLTKYVPLVV